jgi:hypothetical protein
MLAHGVPLLELHPAHPVTDSQGQIDDPGHVPS